MTSAGKPVMRLGELERVGLDALRVDVEALRGAVDEGAVVEAGLDDLARHCVGEPDVGADVESEPDVGPLRGRRAAAVNDVEARAVVDRVQHVMEEDGVVRARVGAPQEDDVRLLDLAVGRRASPRTEHRRQTDDAGACQVRLQLSMLRVPSATRASFAARKLGSFVDFEQLKMPVAFGPRAATFRARPSTARPRPSSQEAGRRAPEWRTSGSSGGYSRILLYREAVTLPTLVAII
jgi:hypothetical protein